MAEQFPDALAALLSATDPASQEIAWEEFVRCYSPLLLHVARSISQDYDDVMDRYAFVLERLRNHNYERLRGYAVQTRSQFTTWLVVVARRLCLDLYRHHYGRTRGRELPTTWRPVQQASRKRLVDAVFAPLDQLAQAIPGNDDPITELDLAEQHRLIDAAVAALTPEDRTLLKLRFDDELPARTIATLLLFPSECHVYRRLRHVIVVLRERLKHADLSSVR